MPSLSVPVVQAMAAQAEPDLLVWEPVIPEFGLEQLLLAKPGLDAKLNPTVSGVLRRPGMLDQHDGDLRCGRDAGRRNRHLTMVGGSEVMSRPSIALTADASKRLNDLFARDATALAALQSLTPRDYVLPHKGAGQTGSPEDDGVIMEETAKACGSRASRRMIGRSRATSGQSLAGNVGFFDDLVISLPELARDANPRRYRPNGWPLKPASIATAGGEP